LYVTSHHVILLSVNTLVFGAASPPAGGAATDQVVGATLGAVIATLLFVWVLGRYRAGGAAWLRSASEWAQGQTRLPAWAALPGMTLGASLQLAGIGMYWDISIHIDNGRDAGPLANPAHYLILVGLFGVMFSAALTAALTTEERPSASAIRLPNGWWAPIGGVVMFCCGAVSLIAFPLDDMWHRIFGQDVTLWGPTHLLLIGGAASSIVGHWILQAEAEKSLGKIGRRRYHGQPLRVSALVRFRDYMLSGALLAGLCTMQAEFDFGIEQFRLVWHPILLASAAAIGLVAARLRLGRGGALGCLAAFFVIRGILSMIVGPVLGHTLPHIPIFVVEALIVEAVGLRYGRSKPLTLGLLAGVLIGSVGFVSQYFLSNLNYIPWPPSLFAEGLACALIAGTAGGVLGGAIGRAVSGVEPTERLPRGLVPAAGLAVILAFAWAIPMPNGSEGLSAQVKLADAGRTDGRWVYVTATLTPPDAAKDARWFNATSWQGGGSLVTPMEKVGDGVYRSAKPVPAYGDGWKTMLRLQSGRSISAMPLYMPADNAIPAPAVAAPASFSRAFVPDVRAFQREQKQGVPGILKLLGYFVVLFVSTTMIGIVCWGLSRVRRGGGDPSAGLQPEPSGELVAA